MAPPSSVRAADGTGPFGERLDLSLEKIRDLRYGENPHQRAAWYSGGLSSGGGSAASGFSRTTILQGKELSYTNLLDLDAAARIVLEFDEPAAVVVKHTNPCGAAIGSSAADAYVRARDADSLSAFGGIVGPEPADRSRGCEAIVSTLIDAVIAPAVDDAARPVLARKTNDARRHRRVRGVEAAASGAGAPEWTSSCARFSAACWCRSATRSSRRRAAWGPASLPEGFRVATKRQPTTDEWQALRFAWRVCAHVKSNTVIFTDARQTLAVGAGQMSRVDAVNVAVMKARESARSLSASVAASDAFFPFRDGLDAVAAAGATAVVQPGGSVKDAEVIAAADEHGLAMVFTGFRHFRH